MRVELEHIGAQRPQPLNAPPSRGDGRNPLWWDYVNPIDPEFEWDGHGHFIPIELDDLLPARDLHGVVLTDLSLDGSYLYPVNFDDSNLTRARLRDAIILDVSLRGADLSHADLRRSFIAGDLSGANLYMARLERSSLAGCNLNHANLGRAKLGGTDLRGADLRGANLSNAHFDKTVLSHATLIGVDFSKVRLNSVDITGATVDARQLSGFLAALRVVVVGGSDDGH